MFSFGQAALNQAACTVGLFPSVFEADCATVTVAFCTAQVTFVARIAVQVGIFAQRQLRTQAQFAPRSVAFLADRVRTDVDIARFDEIIPHIGNGIERVGRFVLLGGYRR